MPTQEERLTSLERTQTTFQRETAAHIRETDENITIMLGVIRDQGRDIKRIVERLETIEQHLDRMETKFDEQSALLTQILTRLPEKNP